MESLYDKVAEHVAPTKTMRALKLAFEVWEGLVGFVAWCDLPLVRRLPNIATLKEGISIKIILLLT